MTAPKKYRIDTREDWLNAAVAELRPMFAQRNYTVPDKVRVSCGFPGGHRRSSKFIGQCWSNVASSDGTFEIFVSPTLDDHTEVLATLAHEVAHAAVGLKAGHRRPFAKCCESLGLEGPWKATSAGPAFKQGVAAPILKALEVPYPHAKLRPGDSNSGPKKQTTRLMKCECPSCGYTVRTTMKWILTSGTPRCPTEGCDLCEMEYKV